MDTHDRLKWLRNMILFHETLSDKYNRWRGHITSITVLAPDLECGFQIVPLQTDGSTVNPIDPVARGVVTWASAYRPVVRTKCIALLKLFGHTSIGRTHLHTSFVELSGGESVLVGWKSTEIYRGRREYHVRHACCEELGHLYWIGNEPGYIEKYLRIREMDPDTRNRTLAELDAQIPTGQVMTCLTSTTQSHQETYLSPSTCSVP